MINGIYQYAIEMKAPIGSRYGRLILEICDEITSGTLTLFRQTLPISAGKCIGNQVRFSGDMKTLLYTLPYRAEGTIESASIELKFQTEKGCFDAIGKASIHGEGDKKRA